MNLSSVVLFFTCLALSSCFSEKDTSSTMNRILVNSTNKIIIQDLETSIGNYRLKSNGNDTSKVELLRKGNIEGGLAVTYSTVSIEPIYVLKDILYCISDTTKYEYKEKYSIENYDIPRVINDSIYFNCFEFHNVGKNKYHPSCNIVFEYTTTLNILKKDYSMLEKFKEYYKK